MTAPAPAPFARRTRALRGFLRGIRGGAAVEMAVGTFALIAVAAVCFDLYSRIDADTSSARMAYSMADYVSRETAPNLDEITALGRFLHEHEIGVPSNMAVVVSAIHQPAGSPLPAVDLLWSDDSLRFGDAAATQRLANDCPRFVNGANPVLPSGFVMVPDEVVIIAEVCVELTRAGSLTGTFIAGDIYRLTALPARTTTPLPARPS